MQWGFRALIGAALISIGFLLGKYASFPVYYFKRDLDVVAIATLIANIFLAWYLATVITKQQDKGKKEKDILLNRVDRIISSFEQFESLLTGDKVDITAINTFLKRRRIAIDKICKRYAVNRDDKWSVLQNEFLGSIRQLRILTTYEPPMRAGSNKNTEINIVNGSVSFSDGRREAIMAEIDLVIERLVNLQLYINKIN